MLGVFGFRFLLIGNALTDWARELEAYAAKPAAKSLREVVGDEGDKITADHPVIKKIIHRIPDVIRFLEGHDLGTIEEKLKRLRSELLGTHTEVPAPPILITRDIIKDIKIITQEFIDQLRHRYYYYVPATLREYHGQTSLFGPKITKKFPTAATDIEHAGNCLALGESTAAVLHLIRAMDLVTRTLGKKLKVTISPKSTWGQILRGMHAAIEKMPSATLRQKKKKARWSECRAHLYHVKQAWRDDTVHTERNYSEKEAQQIVERMKEFLEVLATL